MSFLTLEDVNTALYSNQEFWTHYLDLTQLYDESSFANIKIDFCTVSMSRNTSAQYYGYYDYTIQIDNGYFARGVCYHPDVSLDDYDVGVMNYNVLKFTSSQKLYGVYLYMGIHSYTELIRKKLEIKNPILNLNLKQLQSQQRVELYQVDNPDVTGTRTLSLNTGFNEIRYGPSSIRAGFLLVNLLKTDFKFNCTQQLIGGKVNKVQLGTDSDYLPNGDMIGEYTPSIRVLYNDKTLPVTYDNTLNDYTFDIDLTNHEKETDIPLTVYIDNNEVINQTETNIRLKTRFETIDSLTKVNTLFANGGTGRLGANITLNTDLTVTNDVYLIGNDHTINLDGHKIIIPSNKTFKADNTHFRYGENTIQQNTGSKVELTDCTFGYCTGLGSVIDCQVNLDSLSDELDFTTNLTRCIIAESDMAILHGGELTVTDCRVQGIISNPSYPYFLYQTDGHATILHSEFTLINNTQISNDIEFNSCIFICGETAQINGYSHTELQNNNLQQFLETQRNSSIINVTYYYTPINDYITLYSEKGYCHSVSDVDFVFKSNITISRGD